MVLQSTATVSDVLLPVALAIIAAWFLLWILIDVHEERDAQRKARIEVELDAKAEQLRQTILSLADDLAAERDDASRALTRAMFLTTGRTDHTPS